LSSCIEDEFRFFDVPHRTDSDARFSIFESFIFVEKPADPSRSVGVGQGELEAPHACLEQHIDQFLGMVESLQADDGYQPRFLY
jgi:hypothetical protein